MVALKIKKFLTTSSKEIPTHNMWTQIFISFLGFIFGSSEWLHFSSLCALPPGNRAVIHYRLQDGELLILSEARWMASLPKQPRRMIFWPLLLLCPSQRRPVQVTLLIRMKAIWAVWKICKHPVSNMFKWYLSLDVHHPSKLCYNCPFQRHSKMHTAQQELYLSRSMTVVNK